MTRNAGRCDCVQSANRSRIMETIKERRRTYETTGRSTEHAVLLVLLLAVSGLFAGFSIATFIGVLSGAG